MEFNCKMSPLVASRPSDDVELSKILASKTLPHVNVKLKEKGLGSPWAAKAQILLHSHLERVSLHSPMLEIGGRLNLRGSLSSCEGVGLAGKTISVCTLILFISRFGGI